jgi:hypothetical protein
MGSGTERELDLGVWRGCTVLTNARVFFVGYNTTNAVGRIRLCLQYSLRLGGIYFLGGAPSGRQRLPLPANPGASDFSGCRFRPPELTSRRQSTPVSRPTASPRATRRVQLPQPGQYRLQAIPVGGASDRARRIRHHSTDLCRPHNRHPGGFALRPGRYDGGRFRIRFGCGTPRMLVTARRRRRRDSTLLETRRLAAQTIYMENRPATSRRHPPVQLAHCCTHRCKNN